VLTACLFACLLPASAMIAYQAETVTAPPSEPVFASRASIEGHLALTYSPAAAFSPDSRRLAVISGEKIKLMDLSSGDVAKVLKPHLKDLTDFVMDSANFISPTRVLILGRGTVRAKGEPERGTPLLALQWVVDEDRQFDKLYMVGGGGGFSPILYLPHIGRLAMYKAGTISLWNPNSNREGALTLAELAHKPGLFAFSPDGHWLLLARVEGNASADPIVVDVQQKKFVDVLQGHRGGVLSMNFSRDGRRVVTACEDGEVRVWSAPDRKLLQTLHGHVGPVHWADFSGDGRLIASAGEDKTVRVWRAEDGHPLQTLEESHHPLLTVAFSRDGRTIAASAEETVQVWESAP